jgi:hypothetical protein
MAKYTEERMFGMLTDIDRSEKRNAYKKYDLPSFKTGGNNTCPPNSYWDDASQTCIQCTDERCVETDQVQEILDKGSQIPYKNLGIMWDVVDEIEKKSEHRYYGNAEPIWKSKGAQSLSQRLGNTPAITNVGNCMWAAGMGYQCLPETKGKISLMPFESNDKFINAVNKGAVPFSRVSKTHDPNFASQETGVLQPGDIVNFKGAHNSHAMTFSNYNDDGVPIFLDSNGRVNDFGWNKGMWPGIVPNKEKVAYVSRFSPEMFYEKQIKSLEEKARTNPTIIHEKESIPYLKTLPAQPIEQQLPPQDRLQFGGELDKFVGGGGPGDKYYKNNGEQYKKTSAGQWFVWNPTYNNWQYADNGFHNNIDLEKYKTSYASDDASWQNDKPKSNVAKPGTVPYYEEQRNKTLNNPFASYDQKMKATNSPLASNVPIRNNLAAQKAAEEAKVAAEKAKAEEISNWYEQEKEQRLQDALMFGNNPVQVSDATRVDVDYLAPIVGEFRRAEADKQRQQDEIFTTQEKVLGRGFKNIYDYENDPMGRDWDLAQEYENAWSQSGEERPMMNTGEMGYYQGPENTKTGWDKVTGKYYTATGIYDPATRQFTPNPTKYKGSGAIQSVDALWAAPIAIPAALQGITSLAALEIPGMYGATLGNAVNAGFIGHGLHSLPNTGASWYDAYKEGKGDYRDALGNTMWNAVDFVGIGEGAGLKSVAQDVKQAGKYLTTKTPLKNAYKLNPLAPKLGNYNRVVGQDAITDLQNSGVVRAGDYGGVRQKFGSNDITRRTPYPSFGQGSPRDAYIQQTIEQGKTPYIISTDRAMEASTLGRHGKGSTMFPVDESGKFLESFPASEAMVFEGTPNWLTGYKPISTEAVSLGNLESTGAMASENAGMFSSASSTPDLKAFTRNPSKRYVRVDKQGMDDFLAQNPGKKVDVIRQDDWPGVLNSEGIAMNDPLNQTRTLQKSEFDQATEFGTKWAVADPVAYQKVMDDVARIEKQKSIFLNNGNNPMTKMEDLQNQWIDDYVKQNPGKTVKQLKDEYETLRNSNQDFVSSEYYQALSNAIRDNVATSPEIKALYNDAASLQNTIERLNTKITTLNKSTDSLLDPTFKNKIEIIYDAAGKPMPTNPTPVDINRRSSLVYGSESEPSFLNLPLEDQQYLKDNWENIGGVRTGNKTITLGSRPDETVRFLEKPAFQWEQVVEYEKYPFSINDPKTWKNAIKKSETGYDRKLIEANPSEINPIQIDKQSMVVPETVGEIQAHEVGHDLQKFEEAWIDNLQEYRPDLQYSTGHNRNPLAKEFNEAMVNPTAPVPNPMKPGSTKQSSETWKSSVGELHSELMLARYKAAKHFMSKPYAEGALTMDEAIAAVKKLEAEGDQALFDFYLDTAGGNLTKHFKGETEDSIKKLLIQILPGVVPAAVVGAGMMSGKSGLPENRYGGNTKNLSKFIKK